MFQTRMFSPALCWLMFAIPVLCQDSQDSWLPNIEGPAVTVTANRGETPFDEVGSSVTVLTAADLERSGVVYVADALRSVPGLNVVQAGGPGLATTVFIRGAESGHTLFMIDGIEMGDAIAINSNYNLGHLTVDNIERIEIVRGPQSTLYGSDAIGGVVHIITKKGAGDLQAQLNLEGGSYGTSREQVSAQGAQGMVHYAVSGSHYQQDGFSTASEASGNDEDDGYRNNTLAARLGIEPNQTWDLNVTGRHTDAAGDLDNGGGLGQDDPNHRSDDRETFVKAQAGLNLFDKAWRQTLSVATTGIDRETRNDFDAAHPMDSSDNRFSGEKLKLDWQNRVHLGSHQLTFGAETENEKGKSLTKSESSFGPFVSEFPEQEARTTGFYLQDHMAFGNGLAVTLGGRFDDHDRFGSQGTYRGAFSYHLEDTGTVLRASYGTGFKAPSIYQLFSDFGDPGLDPESSRGYDLGVAQTLAAGRVHLGLTYFRNDFTDLITFSNATFAYANVAEANSAGLEFRAAFKPAGQLWISLDHTYLDSEDESTGLALLRRPENKTNLQLTYQFSRHNHFQADVRYVGERDDQDFATFPAQRVTLDAYTVVNLAARFRIARHVGIFGRVENLFDEDYEEVLGYGTPELSGYFGLNLSL